MMFGDANGVIFDAANGDKIFAMTQFMLSPISDVLGWCMALLKAIYNDGRREAAGIEAVTTNSVATPVE